MFRSKNRKRSTSRTLAKHRNSRGRKSSVEQLQSRQLMAGDVGFDLGSFGFYGPQLPNVAAQVSSVSAGSQANATNSQDYSVEKEGHSVNLVRDGSSVRVIGTAYRDEVYVSEHDFQGNHRLVAKTYDYNGNLVGELEAFLPKDEIKKVKGDLKAGHDHFESLNSTSIPVDVKGGPGNDFLKGGGGQDKLDGGNGQDSIYGGSDADTLLGGDGHDYIEGGPSNDIIKGGDGDDTLLGGWGGDKIYGQDGNDTIEGGLQADKIYGGDGADKLYGGDGDDRIKGDAGNDRIYGERGHDTLWGNDGNDFIRGGESARGTQGNNADQDKIYGGNGVDRLYGGWGKDLLKGGSGNDYLYGEGSNDDLYGNGGRDYLVGGDHNDYLDGGDDGIRDILYGSAGSDTFVRHEGFWWWESDDPDAFMDFLGVDAIVKK